MSPLALGFQAGLDLMEYKPIVVCWKHRGILRTLWCVRMLGWGALVGVSRAMARPRGGDWCCVERAHCAGHHKLYLV